jgi:MFS family permease
METDDPIPIHPAPAPAAGRRPSMGMIFLTLFLDLAGFSIIFPISPALLEHYLQVEGAGGILGSIVRMIEAASPFASRDPVYAAALFGGVLGSIYSLLQFLFAPMWGSLSDRIGRRPVLLISNSGIAASYALWAVSGSFPLFIAARLLAGAMGGNISVATAAAADISGAGERAKAMGMVGAAFGLGFICGPVIGGGLSHIDMARLFPSLVPWGVNPFTAAALGALALSAANLLWVGFRFRETLPPGLRKTGRRRLSHPFAFFARSETPGVRRTNLIWFVYLIAFSGMEFTLTFLAHERYDFTPRKNGLLFLFVGGILVFIQGGVVRRAAPRFGERRVAAAGLAAAIPGFALIGLAPADRISVFLAGVALMGVGMGLVQPSISALVSLYAPADRQGTVMGAFRSLGAFSRIIGPLLATTIFWELGSSSPYLLGAAILIPPAVLVLRLPAPPRRGAEPART